MKRVLLVSYYYPPMPAVGALRAKDLAKYLPEFGWDVTVLHGPVGSRGSVVHRLFGIDPNQNLLAQALELRGKLGGLPIEPLLKLYAEVFKYPDAAPSRWCPHGKGHSAPITLVGAQSVLDWYGSDRLSAVISTSAPVSCHMLGAKLHRELGIPWVADFKDLWTQNHYYPYSRIRRVFEERLELRTLQDADALTTTSELLAERLAELHGKEAVAILNGYDPDEVNDGSTPLTERVTYTHTGSIYPGKQSPEALFRRLYAVASGGHDDLAFPDGGVRFYGPVHDWIDKLARKHELQSIVKQYGVVSREEALQRQRESHYLLFLKWTDGQQGIYSRKLFEYLAARRPIVAIGPSDPYVDRVLSAADTGDIEKYSQRETARKFAEVLDSVL